MAGPRRATSTDEGALEGARILVVEARYYEGIADELLAGARRALEAAHAAYDVVTVPGALEIPTAIVIALDAAAKRKAPYDGVVALGCVIRGETSHYDIVAGESARALMDIGVMRGVPVGNASSPSTPTRRRACAPVAMAATRAAWPPPRRSPWCASGGSGPARASGDEPRTAKGRPPQGQPARRGAARRRAGALPDGHGGRRPQRDPGSVRKPLA